MDFKSTRRALGLSQAELATRLGVTQATISRLETGKQPLDQRTLLAVEALQLKLCA
jgi:transcriptional regulator with XRE-family HTH domain